MFKRLGSYWAQQKWLLGKAQPSKPRSGGMPRGGKRPGAGRPYVLDPETEQWTIYAEFRKRWAQMIEHEATVRANKQHPQLATIAEKHEMLQNIGQKFRTTESGQLSETVQELVEDVQDLLRDMSRMPDDIDMSWKEALPRRYRKELRRPQGARMALLKELAEEYSRAFNKQITPRAVERCVEQCRALENQLRTETPDNS